jgi:hypothetical protein
MTLTEVAEGINALFTRYGLDHDVVSIKDTLPIRLDPRENEPDPAKWRNLPSFGDPTEGIVLEDCTDIDRMELLLTTLTYVFDVFFEVQPETGQGRLF